MKVDLPDCEGPVTKSKLDLEIVSWSLLPCSCSGDLRKSAIRDDHFVWVSSGLDSWSSTANFSLFVLWRVR